MRNIISLSIFLILSTGICFSQNYTIKGVLTDKTTKEPIEAATINLLNVKDSTFVAGGFSDLKGAFTLKTEKKGDFLVNVVYVGYKTVYRKVSLASQTTVDLKTIELEEDAILLKEAVVEGKRAEIKVRNDTIEYDAASYKTEENAVIEDLLKKLPGVEVDKDGKISVNGKEIKKFLVEGKEFFSDDPTIASKNLPAQMVDKLQVMDRRSDFAQLTGFDDGEEESVINITVRPGMKQGTIGNAAAGMGKDIVMDNDLRYIAGGMVNYMKDDNRYTLMVNTNNTNNMGAADMGEMRFGGMRGMRGMTGGIVESKNIMADINKAFSDKLSLNGNVSINGNNRNATTDVESATFSENISQSDKSNTQNQNVSDNFNLNFRLDWKPDSSNTFIFRPNISYNSSRNDQEQLFSRFNLNTSDTLFDGHSQSHYEGKGHQFGGSLEFSHKFNKPGRVFSTQIRSTYNNNYSQGRSEWEQKMYESGVYYKDSLRNQRSENDNSSTDLRVMLSFVEPIGRNNFIQLAYNLNYSKSEGINSTYNVDDALNSATLYGNQSRSTERNSNTNRFSLNFKAMRERYNYTVGLNLDPSYSLNKTFQPFSDDQTSLALANYPNRLPNIKGDSAISSIDQKVLNLSPALNFNYLFDERSNLRIDYEGTTNQPSAAQLRDFSDESDPMNITKGNPDLKPGYTNELRARFNKSIPETQLFYNFNLQGRLSFNDITSVTALSENGRRETTYKNINGNWNVALMGGFNTPLKNQKFSVGNFMRTSLENRKSYSNDLENTQKTLQVMDNLRLNFRTELCDIAANVSLNYRKVSNLIQPQNNLETYDWGVGGNTTWYLPYNFTFASDITWTTRSGYAEEFNIKELMWNASLSKRLFNKRFGEGTLKVTFYDILQDRSSVSGGSTTNGYNYTRSTVIPSYFICSLVYKFSIFPKGSSTNEQEMRDSQRPWGGDGRRIFTPSGGSGGGGGGRMGPGGGGGGPF
ncbi:MAG: outer membrane beta-barrel protein [Dysgonamonadaceae bacterium]|jgi:hypothetical protein|nr:outer membrane beta-barrel protein [Dysgonamonadaceae bacterium]